MRLSLGHVHSSSEDFKFSVRVENNIEINRNAERRSCTLRAGLCLSAQFRRRDLLGNTSTGWDRLSVSLICFKSPLSQDKKINNKSSQYKNSSHYTSSSGNRTKQNMKTKHKADLNMPHWSSGRFSFTESHLFHWVIKRVDISKQIYEAERRWRAAKTRKPRDTITSPDHAHESAAYRKTVHTHTPASHATHTHTFTLCKSKY